ncbi:MAG: MmgE/PrpD family protein [Chloroflexota bacterium]
MMGTTEKLARFIAGTCYADIPAPVMHAAKRTIIDTLGVMLAGSREPASIIISSWVRKQGGRARASVAGAGFRTNSPEAALVNGTTAHVLDYDDVYDPVLGHPTAALLPAVLAVGEEYQASGKDILTALVVGFELWAKLSALGVDPRTIGFHPTAVLGTMGAAVAAAKILGLNIEPTQMVLGLAASHAGGLSRNRGTMTKPYHAGNAARNGIISALLVKEGFTAAPDIIEGKFGFCDAFGGTERNEDEVIAGLGKPYAILSPGVTVKKYPTCYLTHRAIDATLGLIERYEFSADDVAEVECETGAMARDVLVYNKPVNALQGKFSLPFCLAVSILERKVGLTEITDVKVKDPRIEKLMKLVRVKFSDEPEAKQDIVRVKLRNGREYSLGIEKARGSYELPLTDEEIIAKYRDCAGLVLTRDRAEQALKMVLRLEYLKNINELMVIIGKRRQGK